MGKYVAFIGGDFIVPCTHREIANNRPWHEASLKECMKSGKYQSPN